jgi:hypothetical protein
MPKHLHIVAFDLPYPPNYGGSTDMFFKLQAFAKLDILVTLHVFLYGGKKPSRELRDAVNALYYYPRKKGNPFAGKMPFIVASRRSEKLLKRLTADDAPVLFEGLHTTYYLNHPDLQDKRKIVRAHNVEHHYYEALALAEERWWKTLFFKTESRKLKLYEKILHSAQGIAGISPLETAYFNAEYGHAEYIPAFHANTSVQSQLGSGSYILYHGNLSVPENNRAALYLAQEVFPQLNFPCIIAGSRPSKSLQKAIAKHAHIQLIADVSATHILELIALAHANVLVTFQSTGIKLKLLNSLYRGRFVVANRPMVEETGLETICTVANTPSEMVKQITALLTQPFSGEVLEQRRHVLGNTFENDLNAKKLARLLFGTEF